MGSTPNNFPQAAVTPKPRVPHSTDGFIVRRACPELAEGVGRDDGGCPILRTVSSSVGWGATQFRTGAASQSQAHHHGILFRPAIVALAARFLAEAGFAVKCARSTVALADLQPDHGASPPPALVQKFHHQRSCSALAAEFCLDRDVFQ